MNLKLQASKLKKEIPWLITFIMIAQVSLATTYYSRTSGGYWNSSSTWSTVTYGNSTNTGTFPAGGDVVYIGNSYTIYLNVSSTVSGITVGQGGSGILEILDAGTFTLTIAGSLTVNTGAKLWYNGNSSRTQRLYVSGNILNNGTMDLYSDANDVCNLTFNSSVNSTVSGSGSFSLNNVILYKATSGYYLDVQTNAFETGIRTLTLSYGRYIHNNAALYNVNPTASSGFQIDADVIIEVPQGSLALSPNLNHVYLEGSLIVDGGTVYIGSAAGANGIRTQQSGSFVPYLEVSSGSLIVYGGISYASGAGSDPFSFKMSGGSMLLNCGSTGTSVEPFYIPDVSGSSFDMSGGTITIQSSSYGGSSTIDFTICGNNGTINTTGGTVEFGNSETVSGDNFTFKPFANAVQPNFKVTGDASVAFTLSASQTGTANFKLLSLYIDVLKTFDVRSLGGSSGDSKTMTITSTYDGLSALYNAGTFTARTGTVVLGGTLAQEISGSNKFTFYNFTMNNISGATLAKSVDVSNQLTMTNGVLNTSATNCLTCLANCSSNMGSSSSYVDGPLINTVATTSSTTKNFPLGKSGAYRPISLMVQHSTTASVTYNASVLNNSARALGYVLPASLSYVSAVRYFMVNRQSVSNLSNATITLSYGSDDMVNDYANLRVARDNGSATWLNLGGSGTANTSGTITSSSFTGFNTLFALANPPGGSNPLPVELLNFNAYRDANQVKLKWSTATEQNSDYFEVEKSGDINYFNFVNHIKAGGNSNTVLIYETTDEHPFNGINYYRLKQVDFDGTATYSAVRAIDFSNKKKELQVFPNPTSSVFNLNINENNFDKSLLHIYDILGRIIDFNVMDTSGKTVKIKLKDAVATGIYQINYQAPEQRLNSTFVFSIE